MTGCFATCDVKSSSLLKSSQVTNIHLHHDMDSFHLTFCEIFWGGQVRNLTDVYCRVWMRHGLVQPVLGN